MWRHYWLTVFRGLKRQPVFTGINFLGLALGMAGFLLLAQSSVVKLHADRFHRHLNRLYTMVQVVEKQEGDHGHSAWLPAPSAAELACTLPGVEQAVVVAPIGRVRLQHGDEFFNEAGFMGVTESFFSVFNFDLKAGNPDRALDQGLNVVLSEALALKYFGQENALGQTVVLADGIEAVVTGIVADVPRTSSITFKGLVSWSLAERLKADLKDAHSRSCGLFMLAASGMDPTAWQEPAAKLLAAQWPVETNRPLSVYAFPFADLRLHGNHISTFVRTSAPASVWIGFALGLVLLLIASTNFITLSLARLMRRRREAGLRKVLGGHRRQIIWQLLLESVMLSLAAVPLALLIYETGAAWMPDFSPAGTEVVSRSISACPVLAVYLMLSAVVTGLLAGFAPAWLLSRHGAAAALRGDSGNSLQKQRGRKILIVLQFTLAVSFIAAATLFREQIHRFETADLGYDREHVAVLPLEGLSQKQYQQMKAGFFSEAGISSVTASAGLPGLWENILEVSLPDEETPLPVRAHVYDVDYDFLSTLKIDLVGGSGFDRGTAPGVVVNQALAGRLGDDVLGRSVMVNDEVIKIKGICSDYIFADIGFEMPPAMLRLKPEAVTVGLVAFSPGAEWQQIRSRLRSVWQRAAPQHPFEAYILRDHLDRFFVQVSGMMGFMQILGLAGVMLAAMGLLGLSAYWVDQRGREIAIRKVLGASPLKIVWLVFRAFLLLVFIGEALALTAIQAGWAWVQTTGLLFVRAVSLKVYVMAFALPMIMAVAAVLSQVWLMMRRNPLMRLRQE